MPTPVYQLAFGEKQQFEDVNGNPLAGAKLFVYIAGTATKATTYQETDGISANTNPIILDGTGALPKGVYVQTGLFKLVLAPSTDSDPPLSPIWTRDQITPINDTNQTQSEWVDAAGGTPTWLSTTTFSVTGDQTPTYIVGRRIRVIDSGGTKYAYITAASFAIGVTTVTVLLDTGVLASPISSASLGLLTPTNPSLPLALDTFPIVSGSADRSKRFRVEADGLTTATTRVGTVPDYDFRFGNLPAGIGPLPYAGSTVPTGWLECDGSAVSRTTFAALFTAISTTWGAGDGSTTFNLPDCRGRVPIGSGTGTNVESFTNTAITTGTDRVTIGSNTDKWISGMQVVFTTPGTAPTTSPANLLDSGDTVFVIRISATEIQFATSLANAIAGTAIDITAAGSGTFTITQTLTARTLGVAGGIETLNDVPTHTHTQNSHAHQEQYSNGGGVAVAANGVGAGAVTTIIGTAIGVGGTSALNTVGATATNNNTGQQTQLPVVQPYVITRMIISY